MDISGTGTFENSLTSIAHLGQWAMAVPVTQFAPGQPDMSASESKPEPADSKQHRSAVERPPGDQRDLGRGAMVTDPTCVLACHERVCCTCCQRPTYSASNA